MTTLEGIALTTPQIEGANFLNLLIVDDASYHCEHRVRILLSLEPLRRVARWVRRSGRGHSQSLPLYGATSRRPGAEAAPT